MQLPRCWQKNVEGLSGTIYIYAASSRISLSTVKAILQDMVYIGVRLKGDTMNQPVGIVGRHPASLMLSQREVRTTKYRSSASKYSRKKW